MIKPKFIIFIIMSILSILLCNTAFSLADIEPLNEYRNILVMENEKVYGVTDQKTETGQYIPIELEGKEKIKALLYKFTMQDDVTIEMLNSDPIHKKIIDILIIENNISIMLLQEWLKDKNKLNRDKAAYLLDAIGNIPN